MRYDERDQQAGNPGKTGSSGKPGRNKRQEKQSISERPSSSQPSPSSQSSQPLLKGRGDYHTLLTYQKSEVIYEITYRFCKRFLANDVRTTQQMVQAARSGKQNIIEGSKAGNTAKETEIRLTNVARASLEELLP